MSPLASLKLSRIDGGFRLLWVLRRPKHDPLDIELATGPVGLRADVIIEPAATVPTVAAADLLEGIDRFKLRCSHFGAVQCLERDVLAAEKRDIHPRSA